MIRLTSAAQAQRLANMLPAVAVERMVAFEGTDGRYNPEEHGEIRVAELGDSLDQLLDEGAHVAVLEGWSPFEYVFVSVEHGRRIFEALVSLGGDASLVLIVPDEPWIDPALRSVLEADAVKEGGGHVDT
jgi:hypothetical protein